MSKTFIIAEIGINHNGDMDIVKKLIDGAKSAGCDAVKFQKRTVETVYLPEELDKPRESPWGTVNRQQKVGLELTKENYDWIDNYCKEVDIQWSASAWDIESQKFLQQYDVSFNKVASAMLTHKNLVEMIADEGKATYISTGMSSLEQTNKVIKIFKEKGCPFELMHCNSTYPMPKENANLNQINYLKRLYGVQNVGYSGHEAGIIISCAAVAMGATSIERHITLDRSMYGSDQAASLEINGLIKLIHYIRDIEVAKGDTGDVTTDSEIEIAKKLRRVDTI